MRDPNKQPAPNAQDTHPGASLMRMLIVGLVLIVVGMFAVAFVA